MLEDYDLDGYYNDWEDEEEASGDPCSHCGPWCDEWVGDGLCMIAISEQARQDEEYHAIFVTENVPCPICGKLLTVYRIPVDKLWTWPGDFYNPLIALRIYSAYDALKGEFHRKDNLCHIWTGDMGNDRLVKLDGKADLPSGDPANV